MRAIKFATFLLMGILLFSAIPHRIATADAPLDWDSLQVGQVVAHGTRDPNSSGAAAGNVGCHFGSVSGITVSRAGTVSRVSETKNIGFLTDSDCNLRVSSKSIVTHTYTPGDPTNNQVYMVDPIGLHLTQETGTATISICGSNICISQYVESPYVFPDGWVNTATIIDSVTFVGNPAHAAAHGDFHWLSNTYQHTLYNSEDISVSGNVITLVCYWSYSGTIVSGVGESCYFT